MKQNRCNHYFKLLFAASILNTSCIAFTSTLSSPQAAFTQTGRINRDTAALHARGYDEDHGGNFKRLMLRSSMKQFLTQRSIQSFVYLLFECRDVQTAIWIENFVGSNDLLHYHGTGKFNMTKHPEWDTILVNMIDEPATSVTSSIKQRGRGSLGIYNPLTGKRNKINPYLDTEDKILEIEIDINPVSLVSRIMSVREHLAREWFEDLKLLLSVNSMILDSYEDAMMDDDEEEEPFSFPDIYGDFSNSVQSNEDLLAASGSENKSYDSIQKYMISSYSGFDGMTSSPLRKSNFDLLFLLSTQESVHRVLKSYKEAGKSKEFLFIWLKDFYAKHVGTYFDGPQQLGSSDEFLVDILTTPLSINTDDDKKIGIIDTHAIAEDIVKTRAKVAKDWRMISMDIPEEHASLQKMLYTAKMAKWVQNVMDSNSNASQVVEEGVIVEGGEFE